MPDATTPGPWLPYFTVHGDPMVVPASTPYPTSRIADVSTAPDDYGRANAVLIAHAPTLAEIVCRFVTGWSDVVGLSKWRRYVPKPIGGNSVDHVEELDEMTVEERDLIVALRTASGSAPEGEAR